jgi:hypothetical protein
VVSGQATLRLPGTTDTSNPAAIGYTDVEADFRALVGHNFKLWRHAGLLRCGSGGARAHRGVSQRVPRRWHAWREGVSAWLLLAQSFNVISEGAGMSIFGGSYEYYKLQLSAVYTRVTPTWSLQGGGYTTYAGRNALQENGLIFGVWHQF